MELLIDTGAATAGPPVTRPCAVPARATWEGSVVAESSRAVRIERADAPPLLGFPRADVHLDRLPSGSAVGSEVIVFDHDVVTVELVETVADDPPLHEVVTRFPDWGDATDLAAVLNVAATADGDHFTGPTRSDWRRPVVEGSQMLGQAIVAAGRRHPGRRVVSAHVMFLRPADARVPLEFALSELSHGRTFTSLGVDVTQDGRRRAVGTLLLDTTAADVIRHAAPLAEVVGPGEAEPHDMSVTRRDIRIVDGAYTNDPEAPVGPPVLDAWVRFRGVPDDAVLHAGLLAQFTGHLSIAAALRPHAGVGQAGAHDTLSTAINAIAISFHAPVRADRWMLYRHRSTFAGDGMTHAECRVHDEAGALVASFTVDAMVRGFAGSTATDHGDQAL